MNEQDGVQEKKIEEHYETLEEKLKSIIDIPSTNETNPTTQDNITNPPSQPEGEKPEIKKEKGEASEINKEVKENIPQEDTASKDISRNINKKNLSDDDNNENSLNNSSNEIKTQKEFYTSKQTLTASSKKNAFASYTKTNTFRLNKNSSDFRIGTDKQIDQRIEESLNRMKEQKKKHDEYMKRLKERYEKNEKEKIKPIPMTLNQKKNNDVRTNSEKKKDFLERMQKNNEVVKKKKEKIKEDKEKKIMAEIKNIEKEKKISKEMVNKKINEIYEWDARRKKKIEMQEKMKKEKEQNELKNCFKPQINDSSKKMMRRHLNRSTDNAFERLYKEDVQKRKVKNEILKNIYTPAFKPTLNKKESSIEVRETTSINNYEDYMTNVDIEKMLRVRVNKKRNKKSEPEL